MMIQFGRQPEFPIEIAEFPINISLIFRGIPISSRRVGRIGTSVVVAGQDNLQASLFLEWGVIFRVVYSVITKTSKLNFPTA